MSYIKAEELLPQDLIIEIQKYIQGAQIYVPRIAKQRVGWGQKNGTKQKLEVRNNKIRSLKSNGFSLEYIADQFNLSIDSIRKIVY